MVEGLVMNKNLKEMITPRWVEEQQGVYIPLIDKVLLKDNVPSMPYDDYMKYAEEHNIQIATKEDLLQMYLQKEEINNILKEHNGDLLDAWFGSSSEYLSAYEWLVDFSSGYCYYAYKTNSDPSRAVVALRENKEIKKGAEENPLCECKPINWEQRRYKIARDVLAAYLSNSNDRINRGTPHQFAVDAIELADALIGELKK